MDTDAAIDRYIAARQAYERRRMMRETVKVHMCVDCAMWNANADDSSMDDETVQRVVGAAAELGRDGWVVVVGGEVDENGEPNGEHRDHDFSWSACDVCRSRLGGSRIAGYLIER